MVMTIQAYAAHKADGVWYKPLFSLIPTLSIIGNVSKSTGILMLNGEKRFSDSNSTSVSLTTKTD
jgi:hypothetical protein